MKNYSIYPLKEYNDISPQTQYSIIVSSKIEEDYHYIIYNNYNHKMYYDDIENGIISQYYYYTSNSKNRFTYSEIKSNPYKYFKVDKSMTYLIFLTPNKNFSIKK